MTMKSRRLLMITSCHLEQQARRQLTARRGSAAGRGRDSRDFGFQSLDPPNPFLAPISLAPVKDSRNDRQDQNRQPWWAGLGAPGINIMGELVMWAEWRQRADLMPQIFDPSKYNQRNLSFQCV
jgi:hypothetical protein